MGVRTGRALMGRNWGVFLAWFLSMTITHGYPDLPDPTKTTAGCGQLKRSYVCDPSNMLTAHEVEQLDAVVASLQYSPSCLCDSHDPPCSGTYPHYIKIALVPQVSLPSGDFPSEPSEEETAVRSLGERLRDEEWKVVERICTLRMVIVYDNYTTRVSTALNYYANRVISDEQARNVDDLATEDYFIHGQLYKGLRDMLHVYSLYVNGGVAGSKPPGTGEVYSQDMPLWQILLTIGSSVVLLVLLLFSLHVCGCRCLNGGGWSPPSFEADCDC